MKTRGDIILGMCLTANHSYGLLKADDDDSLSSGMTKAQRAALYTEMFQLFEHNCEEIYQAAERYEKLRKLNVAQFKELFKRNLKGEGSFDDLVDQL